MGSEGAGGREKIKTENKGGAGAGGPKRVYSHFTAPLKHRRRRRRRRAPNGRNAESALCNGFHYTEAVCDARWSIRRLSEHHVMSCDVCDGQDPTRSTYYGRGIDFAHAHTRDQKALCVTVFLWFAGAGTCLAKKSADTAALDRLASLREP